MNLLAYVSASDYATLDFFLLICVPVAVGRLPGTKLRRLMRALLTFATLFISLLVAMVIQHRRVVIENAQFVHEQAIKAARDQ